MMGTPGEARREPNRILRWSGGGFLLFSVLAGAHALWSAYGSGPTFEQVDVLGAVKAADSAPAAGGATPCATFGPVMLIPDMNPIRAVLATGYTPMGSVRTSYEVAMLDANGLTVWDRRGTVGGTDEQADGFVNSATRLMEFEVPKPGPYSFQVSFPGGSLDDLREARIEIRQGVASADPRITWGAGLAALACLLISLLSPRSEAYTSPIVAREEEREAA